MCRGLIDGAFSHHPITIGEVFEAEETPDGDENIIQGFLRCTNPECGMEYPIIDGVAIILSKMTEFIESEYIGLVRRNDINHYLLSYLDQTFKDNKYQNIQNFYLNIYHWIHYNDFFTTRDDTGLHDVVKAFSSYPDVFDPSKLRQFLIDQIVHAATDPPFNRPADQGQDGHRTLGIDVGCSIGRYTFELGKVVDYAIGMDINFPSVQSAYNLLRTGSTRFLEYQTGRIVKPVTIEANDLVQKNVDFFVGSVLDPPFEAFQFHILLCLNLIDNITSPSLLVGQITDMLVDRGLLLFTSPYNWNTEATPMIEWFGGLTDRGPVAGESSALFRAMLEGEVPCGLETYYEILDEHPGILWPLRKHQRNIEMHAVHFLKACKCKDRTN